MSTSLTIIDDDYLRWINDLVQRYRNSQIKAARSVNREMLLFYWTLGHDIIKLQAESRWGSKFFKNLSSDLKHIMPDATCFSPTNLLYMKNFYQLYHKVGAFTAHVDKEVCNGDENAPQVGVQIVNLIFDIPWGHHKILIDKFLNKDCEAVIYFLKNIVSNGWSRNMLLNAINTDLHKRVGKSITNFSDTMPSPTCDLAQELTRDPYNFAFTGISGQYNEKILKDALLGNITQFLIELGTGFAYVGKEYRLKIGKKEKYIDLLFYNLQLSCYVVVDLLCCAQHNSSYVA